jgi:transcriptional regulator with XRE-family HTH domain
LSLVNHRLIAEHQTAVDHQRMVDTPKPEHYSAFKDWLEAFRASRNLLQADIAEIGGVSAQAVTKWFSGGGVQPKALKKLASAAGVSYAHLRLLLEEQPILEGRQKRGLPPPSPVAQRLARKIELLADDETKITAVEAMIDALIAQQSKERRRGDKVA